LLPVFLSEKEIGEQGADIEAWRGKRFSSTYLHLVRPFSAIPELFDRLRQAGLLVAVASSAKGEELERYLDIAQVKDLIDVTVSSEQAKNSKPEPDIFESTLTKLGISGRDAVTVDDSPYDAEAATRAGIEPIGVLSGGFTEAALRAGGCTDVYPGPASLYAGFKSSLLKQLQRKPQLG
jgi:beta-phosphoglucomutase-like phosphatase (HAD superfamily)